MVMVVAPGTELERVGGGLRIGRHHHEGAYAALVLRGGYVEAGDCGRIRAEAGMVLIHRAFEGHFNVIDGTGADILNLPVHQLPGIVLGRCADPDSIVRLAEHDRAGAADFLVGSIQPVAIEPIDWPDLLAERLRQSAFVRLDEWAGAHRLTASGLSRGFALAYGVTPKRYRLEQRAAKAARAISSGAALSDTAFASGFSDQPHMTRAVRTIFGRSPGQLR